MTQQAVRRVQRAKNKPSALVRGILLSILATALAVLVFAIIIGLMDVPDGVIRIVNQVIKIGAICVGVWRATARGDESAVRRGALIGLIYMGVGVLVYALLTHQQFTYLEYLLDILMGVAAGGLFGMLRATLHA